MKRHGLTALGLAAAVGAAVLGSNPIAATAATAHPVAQGSTAPVHSSNGRYILRLAAGASPSQVRAGVAALGGSVVAFQPRLGTVVVSLPDGAVSRATSVPGVTATAP